MNIMINNRRTIVRATKLAGLLGTLISSVAFGETGDVTLIADRDEATRGESVGLNAYVTRGPGQLVELYREGAKVGSAITDSRGGAGFNVPTPIDSQLNRYVTFTVTTRGWTTPEGVVVPPDSASEDVRIIPHDGESRWDLAPPSPREVSVRRKFTLGGVLRNSNEAELPMKYLAYGIYLGEFKIGGGKTDALGRFEDEVSIPEGLIADDQGSVTLTVIYAGDKYRSPAIGYIALDVRERATLSIKNLSARGQNGSSTIQRGQWVYIRGKASVDQQVSGRITLRIYFQGDLVDSVTVPLSQDGADFETRFISSRDLPTGSIALVVRHVGSPAVQRQKSVVRYTAR